MTLPEFLIIDDVPRPTTNSLGRPIHATEEGIRNFWAWFGNSTCIDDGGRPLVSFHGSNAHAYNPGEQIEAFITRPESGRGAAFFSSTPEVAAQYGESQYAVYLRLRTPLIVHGEGRSWVSLDERCTISGANTPALQAHVASNAKEIDDILSELADLTGEEDGQPTTPRLATSALLDGSTLGNLPSLSGDVETDVLAKLARSWGFDGVIFRDIIDAPTHDRTLYTPVVATTYAVFNANDIKSATHNHGRFDPSGVSITDQPDTFVTPPHSPEAKASATPTSFDPSF